MARLAFLSAYDVPNVAIIGDCVPVGSGVTEMRIHFGPGYRLYANVAARAGLGRESLYKALKSGAKPRFDTVRRLLAALGVKLDVSVSAVSQGAIKNYRGKLYWTGDLDEMRADK